MNRDFVDFFANSDTADQKINALKYYLDAERTMAMLHAMAQDAESRCVVCAEHAQPYLSSTVCYVCRGRCHPGCTTQVPTLPGSALTYICDECAAD